MSPNQIQGRTVKAGAVEEMLQSLGPAAWAEWPQGGLGTCLSVFVGWAAPCCLMLARTVLSIPFSGAQLCTMNPPHRPEPGPSCMLPGWSLARTLVLTAEPVGQAGEAGGQRVSPSCCGYDTAIV